MKRFPRRRVTSGMFQRRLIRVLAVAGAFLVAFSLCELLLAILILPYTRELTGLILAAGGVCGLAAAGWALADPERLHESRSLRGLCGRCAYDLTGNISGVCPECGEKLGKARVVPLREEEPNEAPGIRRESDYGRQRGGQHEVPKPGVAGATPSTTMRPPLTRTNG